MLGIGKHFFLFFFFFSLIWLEFANRAAFSSAACFDEYVIYHWNREGLWYSSDWVKKKKPPQGWMQEEEKESLQLSYETKQRS